MEMLEIIKVSGIIIGVVANVFIGLLIKISQSKERQTVVKIEQMLVDEIKNRDKMCDKHDKNYDRMDSAIGKMFKVQDDNNIITAKIMERLDNHILMNGGRK